MFKPTVERIIKISEHIPNSTTQLNELVMGKANVYIDFANVRPWAVKLGWNIDLKRLWQFLKSFDNVGEIKIYDGTLEGDRASEIRSAEKRKIFKDGFVTKPVKIMKHSIDYTSIKSTATDLLEQFIRKCLLRKFEVSTVELLNEKFKEMNKKGEFFIEDRKCNFDVEIGVDMLVDFEKNNIDTYILWSGDSDFYNPVKKLLNKGKRVVLFATARRVATELNDLRKDGLFIFDIQKIRNYICWKEQIEEDVKNIL